MPVAPGQSKLRAPPHENAVPGCRILTPASGGAGGYALEADFDLAMLEVLRGRMVEIEALFARTGARGPPGQPAWNELARFMLDRGFDYVLAGVAIGATDGGHVAASLHRIAARTSISPDDLRVVPRSALPVERLRDTLAVRMPATLRGFLDHGAWVCGKPAWNGALECARLPLLLPLARMRGRGIRHFLSAAT